jgi:hypothetical protein
MSNNDEELNKINSINEEQNNINNNKSNKNKDVAILKNLNSNKNFNSSVKQSEEVMLENENENNNKNNKKFKRKNSKRNSKKSFFNQDKNNNNNNNNEDSYLNKTQSMRVLQKPKELDTTNFKIFPLWFGLLCAFINLIIPGIGTIIGIIKMNDKSTKKSFAFSGICQFFTSFFIVGWFYALCNSFLYIFAGYYGKSFEEYMLSDG